MSDASIKENVKARYGAVAKKEESCCGPQSAESSCCGPSRQDVVGQAIGYTDEELSTLPEGANLGLGCGNPLALASVREGDTVLDLGSGAGIDCFLAAKRVGETGHVIGVDMTPEMLEKARANAEKGGYTNVEFRQGEIESMPVEDNSVDVVISNCVINLSPDKEAVFREVHRVLKPGGRFFVSDIVLLNPLPEILQKSAAAYAACISGAMLKKDYLATIQISGFNEINVTNQEIYPFDLVSNDPSVAALREELGGITPEDEKAAADSIASLKVEGRKAFEAGTGCCGGV